MENENKEFEILKKEFLVPFDIYVEESNMKPETVGYILKKIKDGKICFDSERKEVLLELKESIKTAAGTDDEIIINEVTFTTKNCKSGLVKPLMAGFEKDQTEAIALFTELTKKQINLMCSSDLNTCAQIAGFFLIY